MTMSIEEAETKMTVIEQRLGSLEASTPDLSSMSTIDAANQAVAEFQKQTLFKLKSIREQFVEEMSVTSSSPNNDALIKENAALKKERDQLKYRMQHLIKELNKAEQG